MHNCFLSILALLIVPAQCLYSQSILKDFDGRQLDQRLVYLAWTTKAGSTCADLSIERSFEGGGFAEVYQYNGICGETDKDQDYHHIDSISQGGRYGYRINENNGNYSDTIFIQVFTDGMDVVVYPNPSHERIQLRFSNVQNTPFDYLICGIDGSVLQRGYGVMPDEAIDLKTLGSGEFCIVAYNTVGYILRSGFLHVRE